MFVRFLAAAAALTVVTGCAIHPVPEDVAGVGTSDIVRQIRCETREALRKQVIAWLDKLGTDHPDQRADRIARRLADLYESEPEAFSSFRAELFPGPSYVQVRNVINAFADAAVGYNFELTMSEQNNLSTEISLLRPLTRPKFTLGINAGAARKRTNMRSFTITDTFGFLVARMNTPVNGVRYCDGKIVGPNYIYPIAGRIGADKLVYDFVNLTLFGNLSGAAVPTMADKLTFTTTVSLSATPRVEFAPLGTDLQLASAQLQGLADRADIHQVTMSLAVASTGMASLNPLRQFLFSSERGVGGAERTRGGTQRFAAGSLYVGARVTGGGTAAERLAVIAIDQIKSRELEIVPTP